jgi:hypothetical protein
LPRFSFRSAPGALCVLIGLAGALDLWLSIPETDPGPVTPPRITESPVAAMTQAPPVDVPADWWSAVQQDIVLEEYRVSPLEAPVCAGPAATYQAPNRAQNFRTRFDAQGIRVQPRTTVRGEDPAWEWTLNVRRWGRHGALLEVNSPARMHVDGGRIEYARGDVVEWYVNNAKGLEQGFTLARRPESSTGKRAAMPREDLRLEMSVGGTLAMAIGEDGQAVDFRSAGDACAIRFDHLLVFDAGGRELESRFECDVDGAGMPLLAVVVDDRDAVYPITIDPLATSPLWSAEGDQVGAEFGISVATAGDVNADGFSDVIVGAHLYDNGQIDDWSAEGNQAGARLGTSVGTAGDVNADGFSDVIIGAPSFDAGENGEGRAFVHHGSASGLGAIAAWTAESNQASALFGSTVAAAGDVNGDGFSDVLVGAPAFDNGQMDEGRAYLYHGSAAGVNVASAWTAESNQAGASFGAALATAGDVNGDNFSDVIIGANLFDNGEVNEGGAFVYHGSVTSLGDTANWTAEGNQSSAFFGHAVATAGDVNGDGFSDVIIGALLFDNGELDEGRTIVYHGSAAGLGASAAWTVESDQVDARLGGAVATAGDVNGDGFADVIVGADYFDATRTNEGRVSMYLGSASGLSSVAHWTADGGQTGSHLGESVATAGDVDGDGLSDVIVGGRLHDAGEIDEGRALIFRGAAEGLSEVAEWSAVGGQVGAWFGASVAGAGDVNGDGYGDVIVGAHLFDGGETNEGRVSVYHGSASGLSTIPNWITEGDIEHRHFGFCVAGAGDVNGDGFDDVAIAASGAGGVASVYFGSAAGLAPTPGWTATSGQGGPQSDGIFDQISSAGDVNGDGFDDLLVAAKFYDTIHDNAGRVVVHHGSASGPSLAPDWYAEGGQPQEYFGVSTSSAGDVDGDGFSDIIIGAFLFNGDLVDEGRAVVYHGSIAGLAATPAWAIEGDQTGAELGFSVAAAGDVNGDGYGDVIVGAPLFDGGQADEGQARVHLGSATGLGLAPAWATESDQADANYGYRVAAAGDVNGDGYSDVAVGAYLFDTQWPNGGRVSIYLGSAEDLSTAPDWIDGAGPTFGFGMSLAGAGDVDGDGFSDLIVGAPHHHAGLYDQGGAWVYHGNDGSARRTLPRQQRTDGATRIAQHGRSDSETQFRIRAIMLSVFGRTRLQMEHEVKPLGVPFDGLDTNPGTYFDIGNDGLINFNRLVSGLTPRTPYHWRVRAKYDLAKTPFQRNGPWVQLPGLGWNDSDLRTAGALVSVEEPAPGQIQLLGAGANPGRGACSVRLVLPRAGLVEAEVFDVRGRRIAELGDDAPYAPGAHVLTWDGRDHAGATAAAGTYFVRVRVNGETLVHKAVLLQ